jgi:hypothetical protein
VLLVLLRVLHVLLHLLLGNARQHSVLLQLGECTQQCPAAFLPPAHLALLPAVGGAQCSGAQGRASPGVRGAARPLPGAPCCCRLRCPQVCPPSASCRPRRCLPAMRAALCPAALLPCCPQPAVAAVEAAAAKLGFSRGVWWAWQLSVHLRFDCLLPPTHPPLCCR